MSRIEGEKALKRYLKRRIGYSITILIGFLINGEISLGADINKELQIQKLLENIKFEKEELNEKLLELEKELAVVKNSKDSSIHILFSPTIEHRHAKKSNDNGFSDVINDWEDSIKDEPNIDIPDIRDDIEPEVPSIDNPLSNEDSIVKEPDFKFDNVGETKIDDTTPNIDLNLGDLTIPVKEITDEDLNILTDDNISKPTISVEGLGDITLGNVEQNIKTEINTPTINEVVDLSLFEVKTINIESPNVTTPETFSLDTVKIKTGSFSQDIETAYAKRKKNPDNLYVVKNYTEYRADEEGFNIWVNQDSLFYDNKDSGGNKQLIVKKDSTEEILGYEDEEGQTGKYTNKYKPYNESDKTGLTTTFISDAIGKDVKVSGKYHLTYEGNRYGTIDNNNLYVRTFLSSSSYGLNSSEENIKLTEFTGELNLATTDNKANIIDYPDEDTNGDGVIDNTYDDTINKLNGNLIGLEHQIWDYDNDKNSILLNSGKINIGMNINREGNNINKAINKNMIGIMIDSAQSSSNKKKNNQTINAGEINIIKPEYNLSNTRFTPRNNIGISFEENESGNKDGAILRDDVYIGKINIGDNTTQNYGFRMGNIYSASSTYFDKTKIIGNLNKEGNPDSITIENDNENNRVIENYTSDIVVAGSQNVGMVVGKSLSDSAKGYTGADTGEVNPIANFENISIKVDGDQTIGFVRDKDYSNNNTNDMVITDSNLNNIRFGENATNSVLFRSEMYGITNDSELDVTIGNENTKATSNEYNVVMQATRQSWDKNGDGEKDTNSSGSVTNGANATISGTVNNMIGMMASGNVEDKVIEWQNGEQASEALATNKGTISLNGSNNIGMSIMDANKGSNSGTITITGENGIGIYNTGTFENRGTVDKKATINVNGENGIGIYNNNSLNLLESTINIGGENSVGIYSESGTVDFGSNTTIMGDGNSIVGIYAKNKGSTENSELDVTLKGEVLIDGTKVGFVSDGGTTNVEGGNIGYSGKGFALQTINDGKIVFDSNSTLTLGGSAYGVHIDAKDKGNKGKYINFNGAKIKITSNNVTLFNIDGNGENYSSERIESGDTNLPGEDYLKKFVGNFTLEVEDKYKGYKMASIEDGNILLNSLKGNNEGFLRQYKFQRSRINMITDTNLTLSDTDANTYFNGEVIGIGISSTSNISQSYVAEDGKTIGEQQREETQINIENSTLTANRANKIDENTEKSTIGAYIDYGVINIGYNYDFDGNEQKEYKEGHIVVENYDSNDEDKINNNGIGIFSKNGSKVLVNEKSSIIVYGNDGIGIYGEATKEFYKNEDGTIDNKKNKFGGAITKLEINNAGTIDVSSGIGGVGIYADGGTTKDKGIVKNSGTITVGGETKDDSSVGIYGINTKITNTGDITVGCQHNEDTGSHAGIGIHAQNSNVTIGDINSSDKQVDFTLGDFATGIYLDGDSTITLNSDLVFNGLNNENIINTTDRMGIYATNKATDELITLIPSEIEIKQNIDMSNVIGGKAVVVDGRDVTLDTGKTIAISGNNGRGIRVLDNGIATNNGKITINETDKNVEFKGSAIGMVASNKNGEVKNTGTIDINSTSGIGIYVNNSDEDRERDGNKVTSIGTINLNGDKNIGVLAKEFDLTFGGTDEGTDTDSLTTSKINFGENSKESIGVYAENSNITINEDISKEFNEKQIDNILIASISKDNPETKSEAKVVKNNGTISLNGEGNIGIYLSGNTKYTSDIENNNIKGSIEISDGAIGIYADKGASILENINVTSDSKGNPTIGVILQGETIQEAGKTEMETKTISGNITLTNTNDNVVEGKNIGIYANNSNVVVNNTLTLNNAESNGTGIYLKDSVLSGSGTVKITGIGKEKDGKIPNSVGIYYTSTSQDSPVISDNSIKVEIDESNTIGVYVAGSTLTKRSTGGITIGTDENKKVENVTGLVASAGSTINNKGAITLNNTYKSIGIASLGGKVNNSGTITLGEKTDSGTGIFLTGNSVFNNQITETIDNKEQSTTGTIKIVTEGNDAGVGIGIYTKGKDVTIGATGNFDMASGNIAIYSDGTNISSDINLNTKDSDGNDTNIGTTALVAKSDTNGTLVEKETLEQDEKKMNITLAKGSTGIYALDSGVNIFNVSIDATANDGKPSENNKGLLSYGIYLKSESTDENYKEYNVSNTDISLVKGVGIVVGTSEKDKNTKLTLSGSTINVDSYSEGDSAETGIGIYTNYGVIALTGGNTINTSYGVGIYGGQDSNISIGTEEGEDKKDTLNLRGYSVGVYSKGGTVTLGQNTNIVFQQGHAYGEEDENNVSKGVGAYVIDGTLTSSANIKIDDKNTIVSDGIVGLLGKQSDKNNEVTIKNSGNITLSGNSVVGIAGIGLEANTDEEKQEKSKVTITNSGDITISGNATKLSSGIYGKDTNIINGGTISVGQYATGIYYTGTKANDIYSERIILTGEHSIGAILTGETNYTNIVGVTGDTTKEINLGIYLNNYSSESTNIGNITLGSESLGLYINNSSTTINSLGNISIGTGGIGIASIGTKDENNVINDKVTITSNGSISVGEGGTAIYIQDSILNMKSLAGVTSGKDGAVLHINNGVLKVDSTINELTFDGNIGMILENGGNIQSSNGEVSNIKVLNGGIGIIIKGETAGNPSILADETTISLGSGSEDNYSIGVYYQNSNAIENGNRVDIVLEPLKDEEGVVHHTIGTIYDRTYGTINYFKANMDNTTSDSIGSIIRRNNYNQETDEANKNKEVILNAGKDKDDSKDKILVTVDGNRNIGIFGQNSIIVANGNIKVGLDETSSGSIGVYLTANDSRWTHSYTGTGNIEVGSNSYGIYAKNYNVTHNGNIKATGEGSIGIANIIEDKNNQAHDYTHTVTVNGGTIEASNGAIGVFGRDTNIVASGNLVVSGENTTGIVSLKEGNITYNGTTNISGKGTAGIYKNTVLDVENSGETETRDGQNQDSKNTITVGTGEWEVNNLATGIMAISRTKNEDGTIKDIGNSITIENASNMTLGDGSIGIYSAGKNTVENTGDITVGGAVTEGDKTYASIGIYMANGIGGTGERAKGTNSRTITVANNGGAGVQVAGYVEFTNNGKIDVSDGGVGMHASHGATVINAEEGNITVTGKGTGMIATGEGSQATNNGTITLNKDDNIFVDGEYNTSLIGMGAYNGGTITNNGTINVNDGIGMYFDKDSILINNNTIKVDNGVGIMGTGRLENKGHIEVNLNNSNAIEFVDKDLSNKGSLVVDNENGILKVNDNFSNIGGILETDYNIKLNNPTIDITAGGAGFIAPEMSGDIKLDSNFALEGNGLSYTVEDFIDPNADININTSPLFDTELVEGDLTVNKVDYKDITVGNQFDNRDDSLDNILANGGVDADILKNLNFYLDSLGNTTMFGSEANRYLGAIGGNVYSNIQSRMQDISRTFDNSFEEMLLSKNPTSENDKFHIIYTDGDYKNTNKNVVDYDYSIKGLNYMKEYDLTSQGKKYGYTFGFTGARFEFDDSFDSKEDIYSLRGGAHRISYLDNGVSWLTKGEIGYNHHRMDRKVVIPGATESVDNRAWYGSYQISLDNKLRKELFANENSNFGAYTALNLEYGLFDDVKESGNLELKVKSNDYFSSKAIVGVDGKVSKPLNNDWAIRLNGDINYSYDLGNNYDENEVRFRSNNDYYSLASEIESRDVVSGKVSIALDKSDYMSIALHGQASRDFRRDEDYWNVGLTFTYRFNNHAVPEKFLDMHNYFEFDKSELNSKEKENIKEMAEYINKNNMQGTLLIEGHTDDTGKATYNDKLSLKRANSVEEEFKKNLTNKENIQIKVVGYGENKPEYKNINESARSKNRRAQVNLLNKESVNLK